MITIKPIIKWAGGKAKLTQEIENMFKENYSFNSVDTYIEAFVGGGAMFIYLAQKYHFKRKVIIDVNGELINLYKCVQKMPHEVINKLDELTGEFNNLMDEPEKQKDMYLKIRMLFNENIIKGYKNINIEQSAYFIFLNKT